MSGPKRRFKNKEKCDVKLMEKDSHVDISWRKKVRSQGFYKHSGRLKKIAYK